MSTNGDRLKKKRSHVGNRGSMGLVKGEMASKVDYLCSQIKATIKPAIKPRVNAIRIIIIVFHPFLYPNDLLYNGSILFIGNSLERFNLKIGLRGALYECGQK